LLNRHLLSRGMASYQSINNIDCGFECGVCPCAYEHLGLNEFLQLELQSGLDPTVPFAEFDQIICPYQTYNCTEPFPPVQCCQLGHGPCGGEFSLVPYPNPVIHPSRNSTIWFAGLRALLQSATLKRVTWAERQAHYALVAAAGLSGASRGAFVQSLEDVEATQERHFDGNGYDDCCERVYAMFFDGTAPWLGTNLTWIGALGATPNSGYSASVMGLYCPSANQYWRTYTNSGPTDWHAAVVLRIKFCMSSSTYELRLSARTLFSVYEDKDGEVTGSSHPIIVWFGPAIFGSAVGNVGAATVWDWDRVRMVDLATNTNPNFSFTTFVDFIGAYHYTSQLMCEGGACVFDDILPTDVLFETFFGGVSTAVFRVGDSWNAP
jgi:hypothetical protein